MAKIKVAVIGAGGIGGTHLAAYKFWQEKCEIVGIADINLAPAEAKAREYGSKAFQSSEEMLDKVKPDAVSICTPPNAHLASVQAAVARGIAVLCEKPPARTLAETEKIVETAAKGVFQFAFCHRFHEPVMQAREMIANGKLGKPVQIYNRFGFRFDRAGHSWFTDKEIAGGGVLIDTLVHSIDIFRAVTAQEINRVTASISTLLPNIRVEDSASILVTSTGGVSGSLNCSWVTPVSEAEIRIYGTQGEAVIDYNKPGGLLYKLAGEADWTQLPADESLNRFTRQADHFLKCVESGTQPIVSGADGIAVMKVIDAAYGSLKNGDNVVQ
jgi:UDP-N-acetylglucosamine 3-dehydrogenase